MDPLTQPQISTITLAVADLQRTIEFYRDGLGCPAEEAEDHAILKLQAGAFARTASTGRSRKTGRP